MPYDLTYGRSDSSEPKVWRDVLLLVVAGVVYLVTRRPEDEG